MAGGISPLVFAFIGLLITTNYASTWERQRSREYPLHSVIIISFIASVGVAVIKKFIRRLDSRSVSYVSIDQDEGKSIEAEVAGQGHYKLTLFLNVSARRRFFHVVLAGVIVRACIFVHVENNTQCAFSGLEVALLPIVLCTYDYLFVQRNWIPREMDVYDMSNNFFEDMYQSLSHGPTRYILPTLMFSLGAYMTTSFPQPSTYICSSMNRIIPIPLLQVVATLVDAVVITLLYRLQIDTVKAHRIPRLYSIVSISVAMSLTLFGLVYGATFHQLSRAVILDSAYIWSVIVDGLMWSVLLVCFEHLVYECRALALVTIFLFLGTFTRLALSSRLSRDIFPPHAISAKFLGWPLLFFGSILMMSFYKSSENNMFARRIPKWAYVLLTIVFVVVECIYVTAPRHVGFSPINYLMYEARIAAQTWLTQASKSPDLGSAVTEYRRRYGRPPPPNFDRWFEYAMARNAYVIDDYDRMEETLLPFWTLEPAEIRQLTTLQDPDHDIAGITIRSGTIDVGFTTSREATWITDTAVMIANFSQWLPDMNIGFNVRNTPLVAVPWKERESMKDKGRRNSDRTSATGNTFSTRQEPQWPNFDHDSLALRSPDLSPHVPTYNYVGVFNDVFAPTCPRKSAAHKGPIWDLVGHCQSCARPHTIGPFTADWQFSTDMCHQPDMAMQHSYLMSRVKAPTKRSPRQALTPLFSRRTLPGFNDILFPGPDSYLASKKSHLDDGTTYNDTLPFFEKENTLYWRGSLDNTLSSDGSWQGQEQQRLSHHINNSTEPTTLLLPTTANRLAYKSVHPSLLRSLISTSIHLTPPHLRTTTTSIQIAQLGLHPAPPLSSWYAHAHLLALDRNASHLPPFSDPTSAPTFLQILASNSLPYRAQIFQSWFDDRIIPWLHYIPVDVRFQGLWATAAYFMGLGFTPTKEEGGLPRVKVGGWEGVMEPKRDQAAFVARTGRDWVERTVREEDAQVYAFRLLLEWGRLVDDQRERLGFSMNKAGT